MANPQVLQVIPGDWGPTALGAISRDGRRIVVGRTDGKVEQFDPTTGQRLTEPAVTSPGGSPVNVAISEDGSFFVSADLAGMITFWDLPGSASRSQRLLPGAQRKTSQPLAPSRSATEAFAAIDGGTTVVAVPAQADQPLRPLMSGLAQPDQQLAVSPDGTKLAIGTTDMIVTIVELSSGATLNRIATGLGGATIGSLTWSPDGTRLAQGNGGTRGALGAVFDVATSQRLGPPITDASTPIGDFIADGTLHATGSSNGFLQFRNPNTGAAVQSATPTFVGIGRNVLSAPDGRTLYVLGSGGLAVIALDGRGKLADPLPFPLVTRGTGGMFAADLRTGKVDVLDDQLRSHASLLAPDFRTDALLSSSLDLSPDGSKFAAGSSNGIVSVLDVASGAVQVSFTVPFSEPDSRYFRTYGPTARNWVGFVRWSPDGTLLAVGRWDRVYVFDAATGALRREIAAGWKDQLNSLSFSPDRRMLAVGSFDGTGMVVEVGSGAAVGDPFGKGQFAASSLAWTPDGHGVLVVDNLAKTIKIVDLATRQLLAPTIANFVSNLGGPWFDRTGKRLLAFGTDGLIGTFDVAAGEEIGDGFGPFVLSLAFPNAAGGTLVANVSTNPIVSTLWHSEPADWDTRAFIAAGRNLTAAEWTKFVPNGGVYRKTCEQWPLAS